MRKLWGRLLCSLGRHEWNTQRVYPVDVLTLVGWKTVYYHKHCERCGRLEWPSREP